MQRVTNCILQHQDHWLLLKKPSKGWYAMPGGKMEFKENIKQSVLREFREETGLHLIDPALRGVFTMVNHKEEKNTLENEWMMYTFFCDNFEGELIEHSREGELEWVAIADVPHLPTAPSDTIIHQQILQHQAILYGTFEYTSDHQLTHYTFT